MSILLSARRSITLTELIIAIALISVIIGAAITPFIMQQGLLKQQMAHSTVQDSVSVALSYMNKDIFRACAATIVGGSSVLRLELRCVDNQVIEEIEYARSGDVITRTVIPVSGNTKTQNIARNITGLEFTEQGSNYVGISITGHDENQTITQYTGVALRATRA
jgi:hypothetical protein